MYVDVESGGDDDLVELRGKQESQRPSRQTPVSGRLYCNDAARLNYWNYGSMGTVPTFIAGLYRTNGTTFTATGVDGLAFANGNLYGATQYASTTYKRGIYQISTTPDSGSHCVMTPLWLDPTGTGTTSGTLGLGGLEYNPANNLFYHHEFRRHHRFRGNLHARHLHHRCIWHRRADQNCQLPDRAHED